MPDWEEFAQYKNNGGELSFEEWVAAGKPKANGNEWWEKGIFGTEAWGDEAKFLQFLASLYGSWVLAAGYRGIYSFQLRNSPLYRWWLRNDKPSDASGYREAQELAEKEKPAWEIAKELRDEPLYVDEYPEGPPIEPGEGFEWKELASVGGWPVRPRWVMKPIEEIPEEEPVWEKMGLTEGEYLRLLAGLPIEEEEGMTPSWQQAQLELQQQQFAWQQQQAQQEWQTAQAGREAEEQRRLAMQLYAGVWRPQQGDQLQQKAEQFEEWRSTILGELQSPRDWITRWQLQNRPNPYTQPSAQPDQLQQLEEELDRYERALKRIFKRMDDPDDPLTRYGVANPTTESEAAAAQILQATQDLREQVTTMEGQAATQPAEYVGGTAEDWASGDRSGMVRRVGTPRPERPTTPATPQWLSTLYPEMGANISKMEVAPLSAQAWQRLTPSQQQGWMGYAEWAGGIPQDLLSQTAAMLPSPKAGTGWTPSRQFA